MRCYDCGDDCIGCERLEKELDREYRVHREQAGVILAQRHEIAELQRELIEIHRAISKILTDSKIMQGWQDVRNEGVIKGSWTR